MKRFVIIFSLVALHLLVFEALVRMLGLRELTYTFGAKDIALLMCVPFAVPTIPALLETRLVSMALGAPKFERLEQGVYPVDVIAGITGIILGGSALLLVKDSMVLWPVIVGLSALLFVVSGWFKYDLLKRKLNGGLKKPLGLAVFSGNMLGLGLFLGAWLLLLTQKLIS